MSPLVVDSEESDNSNNNNEEEEITLVLPGGLDCLRDGLTQSLSQNQSEREALDKLDQDLDTYMRNAKSHIEVLHAEAKKKAKKEKKKVEMIAKDPLEFWFAQVRCMECWK